MYRLHPVDDSLKADLLRWRNAEATRKAMITQDVISQEAHAAWWERVKMDASKRFFVLWQDQAPVGVVNFFDVDGEAKTGWWGFYPAEEAVRSGQGGIQAWLALEQAALVYAFEHLGLEALLCETRHDNVGVLSLHDRMGFVTLPSEDHPNAVKHGLIVKRFSREAYARAKAAGDLPLAGTLEVKRAPFDEPPSAATPAPLPPTRLAILGSANWDSAARDLAAAYEGWTGRGVDVYTPPFGQFGLALLDPQSPLRRTPRDFLVFAERFEDLIDPFGSPSLLDEAAALERFERYLSVIRHARAEVGGVFVIHDFAPVRSWPRSLAEQASGEDRVLGLCRRLNEALARLCAEIPDAVVAPLSELVREVGARNADPGKYWMLGRFAYAGPLIEAWSSLITGIVLARRGQTARALVLDLDNTLWGGVVGDDGVAGLRLSSDYPGNEFKQVQGVAAAFRARGVPLAISSKNTERVALEAIANHPEMVLREKDFAAMRINWRPKSLNIREMAEELGLGLGSLMFIDDNPVERAEVRRNCPSVIVPEMPEDVSVWPDFLIRHPALTTISLSAEDLNRSKSYEIRRDILAAERSAPSREAFLKDLGMTLEVLPVEEAAMQRVLQLISKTNQFNTTGKRYSAADLAHKTASGGDVLTLRLKDKFGSDELIGVVVVDYASSVDKAVVENFIMSCRVLGRGVEAGALAVVSERALGRGRSRIEAQIVPTDRNEPCRSVYSDNGFTGEGETAYHLTLEGSPLPRPVWLAIATPDALRSA